MNNQSDLDKELADMTDNLLGGKLSDVSPENEAYAKLVKQLYQAVSTNSTPDAAFRARLTQRLNQEWNTAFQKQPKRFVMPRYAYAFAALAAVLILVLAISTLTSQVTPPVGADLNGNPAIPIIAAVVGVVIVLGVLIFWRRK